VAQKKQTEENAGLGDQLALVISSEKTVKVLIDLVERAGSASEIGKRLGLPTPTVSHHIRKLKKLRLIEMIDEDQSGRAIRRTYRAVVRPVISTKDWEKLSLEERQKHSIWIVQLILRDAGISFDAALFDSLPNTHLSRTPVVVDVEGLSEISAIQTRALNAIIEVEATSAERMIDNGDPGVNAVAAMMCFPMPEPGKGPRSRRDLDDPEVRKSSSADPTAP
jgi:DNA-binding transcriptional ArsR family regulator